MFRIANMPFAMCKRMRDFAQEVACLGDTKHKENEPPVTITDSSVKEAIGEPDNAGKLAEPTTDNPEMVIDGAAESVIAGLAEPSTAGGAEPGTDIIILDEEMGIASAAESVTAGLGEPVTDIIIPDEGMGIDSAAEPGTAGGVEPLTGGAAEPTTQFNPAA